MATLYSIPMSNSQTWYTQAMTLAGQQYNLEFYYNTRADLWFMDILDVSENIILAGVPLTIDRNLTGQYTTLALPDGTFFCTDNTGNDTQPTLASFVTDHTLYFYDENQ